jgi:hypothetical protein
MDHLNNIGYNKIDRLQTKEISQIHLADPYLNTNDVNKIATTNLGDSFTFVFNIGNTKTVSLVNNRNENENENDNEINNNNNQKKELNNTIASSSSTPTTSSSSTTSISSTPTPTNNSDTINNIIKTNSIPNTSPEPTQRQQKLISVLETHINDKITAGDSGKLFYKLLDNKLQIEDYKSLNTIISNLNIPNNYKETYLKVVEIFISMLVKEKTKGEKKYKNKDISEIVINLTS